MIDERRGNIDSVGGGRRKMSCVAVDRRRHQSLWRHCCQVLVGRWVVGKHSRVWPRTLTKCTHTREYTVSVIAQKQIFSATLFLFNHNQQ